MATDGRFITCDSSVPIIKINGTMWAVGCGQWVVGSGQWVVGSGL